MAEVTVRDVADSTPAPPVDDDWRQNLLRKIVSALENLVTLEIITAVGPVSVSESTATYDLDGAAVALTRINLIAGDITTVFPEQFITGNFQSLKDFHGEREKQGYAMVMKNLEALRELYNAARAWRSDG